MIHPLTKKLLNLWNEHGIVRNFAAVFSVDLLVKASGIILLPLYLKLMTQDEFGLYNYLLSIIGLLGGLMYFGLHISQSKIYFDKPDVDFQGSAVFTIHTLLFLLILVFYSLFIFFKLDYLIVDFLVMS